jgi:dethiobiotin synthetase
MGTRGIFLTGTDTGVGKTLVGCAILSALRCRGLRVAAMKPIETGCRDENGVRSGSDCVRLAAAAGRVQRQSEVAAYLFAEPAAPLVAAEVEGVRIAPAVLHDRYKEIAATADFVLVEGAGGLLVPIAENYTMRDFARELGLPVVVVVASRLGCINHALLTFEVLAASGMRTLGYVVNEIAAEDAADYQAATFDPGEDYRLALSTNRQMIANFTDVRDLGAMPLVSTIAREDAGLLGALAEQHLDLDAIAGG